MTRARTVSNVAYEHTRARLLEDILSGYLAPGSRITIAPLCARYGTSPTPIRQALQELAGQGLVTIKAHQSARVRAINLSYIQDQYELRRAILTILMPRVVRNIRNSDVERLESLQALCEEAGRSGNIAKIMEANRNFHAAIYGIAENIAALEVMEQSWLILDTFRMRLGYGKDRQEQGARAHHRLIKALADRHVEEATKIALDLNQRAMEDMTVRWNAHLNGANAADRLALQGSA
jgi:DNA-binding GntR family transcriptional regulator